MAWLDDVGFVPLLDEELLKIRHVLKDKAMVLRLAGFNHQATGYDSLLAKLSEMHGRDYKIVPLTDADRDVIAAA